MSKSEVLRKAKKNQNDEFYTLYEDIEKEINLYLDFNKDVFKNKIVLCPCDDPEWSNFTKYFAINFQKLGIKKLICTSYANDKKSIMLKGTITKFENESSESDPYKTNSRGKIFILERNVDGYETVDYDDIEWSYLEGDGDFRSEEVKKLRDESDFIITNPPFSLFREFISWIFEKNKKFLVIGNINCIAYKEIFPLLMKNKAWLGTGMGRWISGFIVPVGYELYGSEARIDSNGKRIVSTNSCLWLTNIDHSKRHSPLSLMTMKDNLRYSKHKVIKEKGYKKYDNYNAIDVPYTDAIPSDYEGVMGVPITFLDKYNPEQFEIVGLGNSRENFTPTKDYINPKKHMKNGKIANGGAINCVLAIECDKKPEGTVYYTSENSKYLIPPYARILIRRI